MIPVYRQKWTSLALEMYDNLISQFGAEVWNKIAELSDKQLESHPMHKLDRELEQKLGIIADFSISPN